MSMPAVRPRRWTAAEVRRLIDEQPLKNGASDPAPPARGGSDLAVERTLRPVVKRPVYQRNVPGYWVVDLDSRLIERWLPGDSRPELLTETIEWLPADAVRPFALELPAYFKRVFGANE